MKEEGYTMVMDPQETGAATRKLRLPLVGDAPVMRAETDVIVLISNCPQLNNPCNAYNPTPVRVLSWNSA